MITKNDILLLLTELQNKGEDVNTYINSLYKTKDIPLSTIKYINDKRQIDVVDFYEKIRKSYNNKKSDLYINIVKETLDNLDDILTTLASYNLQVLLFARKLDNKEAFYRATRVEEVTRVLNNYYKTFDIDKCRLMLSLIKADIKLFEAIK